MHTGKMKRFLSSSKEKKTKPSNMQLNFSIPNTIPNDSLSQAHGFYAQKVPVLETKDIVLYFIFYDCLLHYCQLILFSYFIIMRKTSTKPITGSIYLMFASSMSRNPFLFAIMKKLLRICQHVF